MFLATNACTAMAAMHPARTSPMPPGRLSPPVSRQDKAFSGEPPSFIEDMISTAPLRTMTISCSESCLFDTTDATVSSRFWTRSGKPSANRVYASESFLYSLAFGVSTSRLPVRPHAIRLGSERNRSSPSASTTTTTPPYFFSSRTNSPRTIFFAAVATPGWSRPRPGPRTTAFMPTALARTRSDTRSESNSPSADPSQHPSTISSGLYPFIDGAALTSQQTVQRSAPDRKAERAA
mmetsp:Transcript_27894/g.63879  ORF Transcript_27894/g.63879 Transcript_27894/m.63879 type:complete len:236 (-) Transcript_27894:182-889(-)